MKPAIVSFASKCIKYIKYACKIFKNLSIESRCNEVKRINLCYNCLSPNHMVQKYISRTCKHSKRHHMLFHINKRSSNSFSQNSVSLNISTISNTTTQACEKSATTSMKTIDSNKSSEVLLFTAIVYIYDNFTRHVFC